MNSGGLANFEQMLQGMFSSVEQAIGIHVLLIVLERALWDTKHKFEEAALISFSDAGISLAGLGDVEPEKAKRVVYAFIMSIVATLGHLIGSQMARELAKVILIDSEGQV